MKSGQLRTPITLQQRSSAQDSAGQPIDSWADLDAHPVWADFRTTGGLETIKADAVSASTRASARIRWRADITPAMRVLAASQVWQIKAVLPDENRRRFVDLVLEVVR